jgi:hypothetical protein
MKTPETKWILSLVSRKKFIHSDKEAALCVRACARARVCKSSADRCTKYFSTLDSPGFYCPHVTVRTAFSTLHVIIRPVNRCRPASS